jgi:hypothetical protein
MTAEEWIAAYAEALGLPAPTPAELDAMLALASTAAHASERRAAPVACWLAAAAGLPLADAQALAERIG